MKKSSLHSFAIRISVLLVAWIALPSLLLATPEKDKKKEADERRLTYYYLAAEQQKELGNGTAMTELLQHCLEIDPNSPAANFELGLVQLNLRNDSLGLAMLRKAVEHDPNNPWYLEVLASVYLSSHKTDEAIPVLEQMAKLQSKRTDILGQLFQLYKNDGRTHDAINVIDRIQVLQGNSARIAIQKYALYLDLGDTVQAFNQLRNLCKEHPYDVSSLLILGDQYLDAGKNDSANVAYKQVERIDPYNINLQTSRMQYLLNTGDTLRFRTMRDSIVLEEKADISLRVKSLNLVVREGLADSTYLPHAEKMFATILAPERPPLEFLELYRAYRAYVYNESVEQLVPIMERMLEVEPSDLSTLQDLLRFYITQNDIKHVGELCQKALVYHPTELSFHYFLAISLAQQDKHQETINTLQTAIRQANEESRPDILGDIYALLGDVYHEQGNEQAAFCAYDSCLVYAPDNVGCLNNYAYYLSLKEKELEKAEKMSYRTIKVEPTNKTYLDTYAWILFMQEDYTTARIYMDRVVDTAQPDSVLLADVTVSAVLLEHAGDIQAQCGQTETAVRLWKLAQKKDPETKNAILNKKIRKQKYTKK